MAKVETMVSQEAHDKLRAERNGLKGQVKELQQELASLRMEQADIEAIQNREHVYQRRLIEWEESYNRLEAQYRDEMERRLAAEERLDRVLRILDRDFWRTGGV